MIDRTFDSNGVQLRYVDTGYGDPVVLVHSYTSDLERQWIAPGILDQVAQRFRTIAFDLRGHGRSGKPHDPAAYGPELGWDIVRLLDHLGIAKAHLVGYSLGAHIVAQLLVLATDRIEKAVLGGAPGRLAWDAVKLRQAELEAREMEHSSLRTQLLRLWPRDQPIPSEEQLDSLSRDLLAGQDCKALAALRRSTPRQAVTIEDLARVHVPVLGVVGSTDPYLSSFHELERCMPQLRLVVIAGGTHADTARRPEFAQAVSDFLAPQA